MGPREDIPGFPPLRHRPRAFLLLFWWGLFETTEAGEAVARLYREVEQEPAARHGLCICAVYLFAGLSAGAALRDRVRDRVSRSASESKAAKLARAAFSATASHDSLLLASTHDC